MDKAIRILEKIAHEEIGIDYCYGRDNEEISICDSKFGGCPAVPDGFIWPTYRGRDYEGITADRPLSFLAQINMADIADGHVCDRLPKTGLLSIFYEIRTMEWGFDPAHRGCVRVYYFPELNNLSPCAIPEDLGEDVFISECKMLLNRQLGVPGWDRFTEWLALEDVKLQMDSDDYEEMCHSLGYAVNDNRMDVKLLGRPDGSEDMAMSCELISRGYYLGNLEYRSQVDEDEWQDIKEKSSEWLMLFQMGEFFAGEKTVQWDDGGHICIWIRKEDMNALDFSKVWLILEGDS